MGDCHQDEDMIHDEKGHLTKETFICNFITALQSEPSSLLKDLLTSIDGIVQRTHKQNSQV